MKQAERSTNHSLIDLRNVFKSYKTGAGEVPVLKDINLQVKEGEFVGGVRRVAAAEVAEGDVTAKTV